MFNFSINKKTNALGFNYYVSIFSSLTKFEAWTFTFATQIIEACQSDSNK